MKSGAFGRVLSKLIAVNNENNSLVPESEEFLGDTLEHCWNPNRFCMTSQYKSS